MPDQSYCNSLIETAAPDPPAPLRSVRGHGAGVRYIAPSNAEDGSHVARARR